MPHLANPNFPIDPQAIQNRGLRSWNCTAFVVTQAAARPVNQLQVFPEFHRYRDGDAGCMTLKGHQVAIVAVGSADVRPKFVGGEIMPRTMMSITASADHRAVDGLEVAGFLDDLVDTLESPGWLGLP